MTTKLQFKKFKEVQSLSFQAPVNRLNTFLENVVIKLKLQDFNSLWHSVLLMVFLVTVVPTNSDH